MITFVTLFLGLAFGVQEVELLAGEGVAAIEIHLDGTVAGRLEGEPWSLEVDFGEPMPHELVAVALDVAGEELGRVRQWVNLPPPPAELGVVLEEPADDGSRAVRLTWESTVGSEPIAAYASLDGEEIVVEDPRRVLLPPHDPRILHFLRLELDFSAEVSAVREMTFGGSFSGEAAGEMTAVLVRSRKKLRNPEALAGLFSVDGRPLPVIAVERGPAEVVVVPDSGYFRGDLGRMVTSLSKKSSGQSVPRRDSPSDRLRDPTYTPDVPDFEKRRPGGTTGEDLRARLRTAWRFSAADQLRLIWPVPVLRPAGGGDAYRVFLPSPSFPAEKYGLFWILTSMDTSKQPTGEQRLAEAVAAAALNAARHNHRRVVVLQLSSAPQDGSELTPELVRSYLARLQVPLYVWWPGKKKAPEAGAWGEVSVVESSGKLTAAFREIADDLDEQWVVWVEGLHLPNHVALAKEARGISLVD